VELLKDRAQETDLRGVLRLARKLGRFALYGGFGGLRDYEAAILAATAAALPHPDAQALRRQLDSIERLQRWNEDRMVIVGFEDKQALPRLRNEAEDHRLAQLKLTGPFGSVRAAVMTHRGILSSLEFRPTPQTLREATWSLELVALDQVDAGISTAIDREEHP
jgi:hypothetical protein